MTTASTRTAVATDAYPEDVCAALQSLPPLIRMFVKDTLVAQISSDHYVIVSPDDDRGPDWATDVIPAGDEWGVSFETVGSAVLRHFTR